MTDHSFERLTTVQDPLWAEHLIKLLNSEHIDAISQAGGAASSASFAPIQSAFWDILVDSTQLPKAQALVTEAIAKLEAEGAANALAAEEESQGS